MLTSITIEEKFNDTDCFTLFKTQRHFVTQTCARVQKTLFDKTFDTLVKKKSVQKQFQLLAS